jgi:hypothetical protein
MDWEEGERCLLPSPLDWLIQQQHSGSWSDDGMKLLFFAKISVIVVVFLVVVLSIMPRLFEASRAYASIFG